MANKLSQYEAIDGPGVPGAGYIAPGDLHLLDSNLTIYRNPTTPGQPKREESGWRANGFYPADDGQVYVHMQKLGEVDDSGRPMVELSKVVKYDELLALNPAPYQEPDSDETVPRRSVAATVKRQIGQLAAGDGQQLLISAATVRQEVHDAAKNDVPQAADVDEQPEGTDEVVAEDEESEEDDSEERRSLALDQLSRAAKEAEQIISGLSTPLREVEAGVASSMRLAQQLEDDVSTAKSAIRQIGDILDQARADDLPVMMSFVYRLNSMVENYGNIRARLAETNMQSGHASRTIGEGIDQAGGRLNTAPWSEAGVDSHEVWARVQDAVAASRSLSSRILSAEGVVQELPHTRSLDESLQAMGYSVRMLEQSNDRGVKYRVRAAIDEFSHALLRVESSLEDLRPVLRVINQDCTDQATVLQRAQNQLQQVFR